MTAPFRIQEPVRPSLWQRLFGGRPASNALVAINNLLAKASSVLSVSDDDLKHVAETHGVKLVSGFRREREQYYLDYLTHCLEDRKLDAKERASLAHMKQLLGLNDAAVERIHEQVATKVYREGVEEVIADGRLDPEEREFLKQLQAELRLPEEHAQRLYAQAASKKYQDTLDRAIADELVSPEEDQELDALARNLSLEVKLDQRRKGMLERFRLYWMIENAATPPTVEADIPLQKNERCYFQVAASWREHRTAAKHIRYGGPTFRVRIAKGLYDRAGSADVQQVSDDGLASIDTGRLYLTDQRLVFVGQQKNLTMGLQRVLDFTPYQNGVDIQEDSGKTPFLEFEENVDLFAVFLDRALRDLAA